MSTLSSIRREFTPENFPTVYKILMNQDLDVLDKIKNVRTFIENGRLFFLSRQKVNDTVVITPFLVDKDLCYGLYVSFNYRRNVDLHIHKDDELGFEYIFTPNSEGNECVYPIEDLGHPYLNIMGRSR